MVLIATAQLSKSLLPHDVPIFFMDFSCTNYPKTFSLSVNCETIWQSLKAKISLSFNTGLVLLLLVCNYFIDYFYWLYVGFILVINQIHKMLILWEF